MRVVVIGLGSMGKRRINLLREIDSSIEIIGIDSNKKRREQVNEQYDIITYENLNSIHEKMDIAFVCTSPIAHANVINECLDLNLDVFTEINVIADKYDELMEKAKSKGITLFLSSTMLYRSELKYIDEEVKKQKKVSYIYHVGQYLVDWHPWENIKDFFVSNKRTNGCRELFAIELPWITRTFGEVVSLHVQKNKISNLDIDYNDSYIVTLTHQTGHQGVIVLDVVARKATRRLEVVGENTHILWEGTPDSLEVFNSDSKQMQAIETYTQVKQDSRYSKNIIENAYQDEMRHFLNVRVGKEEAIYTFEQDKKILAIIDEIEK